MDDGGNVRRSFDGASMARPVARRGGPGEVRSEVLDAAGELLLGAGWAASPSSRSRRRRGPARRTTCTSGGPRRARSHWRPTSTPCAAARVPRHRRHRRRPDHPAPGFRRALTGTPRAGGVGELIGQAQSDPGPVRRVPRELLTASSGPGVEAVARAQARGQVREDVDPEIVVDQLWGACYHRLLIPGLP